MAWTSPRRELEQRLRMLRAYLAPVLRTRTCLALVLAGFFLILLTPLLIFGAVAWLKGGAIDPAVAIPWGDLSAYLSNLGGGDFLRLRLVAVNLTRGEFVPRMYYFTLEQVLFSAAVGFLLGLNSASFIYHLKERWRAAAPGGRGGFAARGLLGGGGGAGGTLAGAAAGAAG